MYIASALSIFKCYECYRPAYPTLNVIFIQHIGILKESWNFTTSFELDKDKQYIKFQGLVFSPSIYSTHKIYVPNIFNDSIPKNSKYHWLHVRKTYKPIHHAILCLFNVKVVSWFPLRNSITRNVQVMQSVRHLTISKDTSRIYYPKFQASSILLWRTLRAPPIENNGKQTWVKHIGL